MIIYGDLNLKKLREVCDLDFAHFTYGEGQCTCCYGPEDMSPLYWKDRIVKESDYTYILFKNAKNGGGSVKRTDVIGNRQWISYHVKDDAQMNAIIAELRNQMGSEYYIVKPKSSHSTIDVILKSEVDIKDYEISYLTPEKVEIIVGHYLSTGVRPNISQWYKSEENYYEEMAKSGKPLKKIISFRKNNPNLHLVFSDGTICRFK